MRSYESKQYVVSRDELIDVANLAIFLQNELHRLGMFQSVQLMDSILVKIGDETGQILIGEHPVKLDKM